MQYKTAKTTRCVMEILSKIICENCRKEIKSGDDIGFSLIDKFNIGKFGVVYCQSCADRTNKALENALCSMFNRK